RVAQPVRRREPLLARELRARRGLRRAAAEAPVARPHARGAAPGLARGREPEQVAARGRHRARRRAGAVSLHSNRRDTWLECPRAWRSRGERTSCSTQARSTPPSRWSIRKSSSATFSTPL